MYFQARKFKYCSEAYLRIVKYVHKNNIIYPIEEGAMITKFCRTSYTGYSYMIYKYFCSIVICTGKDELNSMVTFKNRSVMWKQDSPMNGSKTVPSFLG